MPRIARAAPFSSSALKGSMSETRIADHVGALAAQALGDEARLVAELVDHRPHGAASAATPYRSLITFDTVATETPASAATSAIVTPGSSPWRRDTGLEIGIDIG